MDNQVGIDKETLRVMFNNQKFTMSNFKNINNSAEALLSTALYKLND